MTAPTFVIGALLAAAWIILGAGMLGSYSAAWDKCAANAEACVAKNLP
jgi:hypothetical protein